MRRAKKVLAKKKALALFAKKVAVKGSILYSVFVFEYNLCVYILFGIF